MRVGSVIASIGITATLVCVGSVFTGLGTRRRNAKRQAVINRLYMPNRISHDVVQINKKSKEFSNLGAQYQYLQISTYDAMKKFVSSDEDNAKLIRRATRNS